MRAARRPALALAAREWHEAVRASVTHNVGLTGTSLEWCNSLPDDPDAIYSLFGPFWDDDKKAWAASLTGYQRELWRELQDGRHHLWMKAQKLGVTVFVLFYMVFIALTSHRGNTLYIVAQNNTMAEHHLERLKEYMRASPALRPYLVERPPRDEVGRLIRNGASTKSQAVIANPERPSRPTRILTKAVKAGGSLISHAHVSFILMTDISAAVMSAEDMEDSFGKAETRLLNTRGTMVIESPPSIYPSGLMLRLGWKYLDRAREEGMELDGGAATSALTAGQLDRAREMGLEVDEPDGEFARDGRPYEMGRWTVRRLHWQVGVRDGTITLDEVAANKEDEHGLTYERLMEASLRTGQNRAYDRGMADQVDDGATTDMINSFLAKTGGFDGHRTPGGGRW